MGTKFTLGDEFKKGPFSVPDGYFETVAVKKKFTLVNEFQQNPYTTPVNYFETFVVHKNTVLGNELKENPFTVPENYFATQQSHIVETISATKEQPMLARWRPLRTQLAFAASLLLLAVTGYGIASFLQSSDTTTIVEGNSVEVLPTYLSSMDEQTLLRAAAHKEAPSANMGLSNDVIIQYLASANISLNDISSIY